ncbi:hypothetical protein D4A35_03095 [Paraclostridium bifermentans]|uniref:ABC-three component systems C-terminal domain-containing protein n=1 Tax=Paraclostridium bifermentans TaxID=1490 RepID=A0A5P3X9L3_PARBF|nr:ABC-three component system protein [Paraclostridium bifermentans]QEZ67968.1 hypothetical protein D4A35_03095 [Paraclostridium bifermentans]
MGKAITSNKDQDASSKWSGYNYQGKVALYVVLYLINNPQDIGKEEDENWENYGLEIEGLEDFSILRNNEYISIHQVKAYTSSNYLSNFKNALWGLIGKTIENESINKSCLHTLEEVNELREHNDENKLIITQLETTKKLEDGFRDKYLNEESLIDNALNKLAFYDNHNSYKLCIKLDEINTLIIGELKKYYDENYNEDYKLQENYVNSVLNKLLFLMDVYIYKRHKKEFNVDDLLSFKYIKDNIDTAENLATHEYFLYEIRRHIGESIVSRCDKCDDKDSDTCKLCNLSKYKNENVWIDNKKFVDFLRNINAHIDFDKNAINFEDAQNIASYITGYKTILETIYEYDDYPGIKNSKIIYEKEKQKYMSTTISHLEASRRLKRIEKMEISQSIINNMNNDAELFVDIQGVNGFISYDVNIQSIKTVANQIGKQNISESDETMKGLKAEYDWNNKIIDDLSIIEWEDILEE